MPSRAASEAKDPRGGDVLVFIVDRVSFEELVGVPGLRRLAGAGGEALLATPSSQRAPFDAYRSLGSGAGSSVDTEQLLARTLADHGIGVCVLESSGAFSLGTPPPGSPMRFLGLGADGEAACGNASGQAGTATFISTGFTDRADQPNVTPAQRRALRKQALEMDATFIQAVVTGQSGTGPELLMVLTPTPSLDMVVRGDEVTPVLMAVGDPTGFFASHEGPHALRSDTTRQDGLVANVDMAPTILDFFGISIPEEMTGSPIRVDGNADVEHIHQLHLDQRRIRLPFQLGLIVFVAVLMLLTIASVTWLRRGKAVSPRVSGAMRFLILCAVAVMIPLMAGGLLPRLTYAVVVPFVVLSTVALAAAASRARWRGPMGPFAFLGAVGLAFMVVDGLFGWRGLRIPLLGGTMFDGARFYGIPNAFLAALLGSSLFLASMLGPWRGAVLLYAAGLFAGFPALGADLGGSATLCLAAGLWWAIRSPGKRPVDRILAIPAAAFTGVALVVLANRYLPGAPTHIAGFVERGGGGLQGVWDAFTRRLDVGMGQLRDVPAAWLPMLGLPLVLLTAIVRPDPVRSGLEIVGAVWGDVLIVLCLAAMGSFFANDTGVAAAAPAFLYAATATAYPVFMWASRR